MKKIIPVLLIALMLFAIAIPVSAISEPLKDVYESNEIDGYSLPYNLFLPENYSETEYYPVLLFLHGAGERGTDNNAQLSNFLPDAFATRPDLLSQAIIIAPQCPLDEQWVNTPWDKGNYSVDEIPESNALKTALELLEYVVSTYGGDRCRIYISGISMGGFGTWDAIMRHEEIFAAAVPICGGADPTKAEILKDMPITTYHDTSDRTVPADGTKDMVKAIRKVNKNNITFNIVSGVGHAAWIPAGQDSEMLEWLFSQTLATRYPEAAETGPRETEPPATEPDVTEPTVTEDPETESPDKTEPADSNNSSMIWYIIIPVVLVAACVVLILRKKK